MAASKGAVPAMRRQQRRVRGVAAEEQRAPFAPEHVAVVAAVRIAPEARAPVLHLDRAHLDVAARCLDANGVVPAQLTDRAEALTRQEVGRGGRPHHGGPAA